MAGSAKLVDLLRFSLGGGRAARIFGTALVPEQPTGIPRTI
jgi:hypothetical protein